ncbi:MAG: discoidin domain-containing protein [Draconibacterium sp.]|nr:discoidin domain-containing protein [Draconibacterium sp.]
MRSYLTAKLLWNPDLDAGEIITDFTNGYYEEAGIFVKNYIDLIHDEIQKDSTFFLFLYGDPAQAFNSWLNPEMLNQYNTLFNKAESAVENKPEVLQRVKIARLSTDYAMLEMARNGMSPDFQLLENGTVSGDVSLRINRFKESCKSAGITLMNEMGYTVEEYLALFENTLQRAAMTNVARNKKVTLNTKPKKYAAENPQALTDGALGGSNFYANWLGFEGNNLEAVIDLGSEMEIDTISTAFLQVTNHIVFFPENVTYFISNDSKSYQKIETVANPRPLSAESKRNDIAYFTSVFKPVKARYIKIAAKNMSTAPVWHNAAGAPVWIFADEVIVN